MSTTFLICGPDSSFADDVHTPCAGCGTPIVRRPHGPVDAVAICLGCAVTQFAIHPVEFSVTPETLREVALYQAKTKGTQ